MTKPLSKFPSVDVLAVARYRVQGASYGLGFWAAMDYLKRHDFSTMLAALTTFREKQEQLHKERTKDAKKRGL